MDKTNIIAMKAIEIMQLKEAKIVVPNKLKLSSKEIQVFTTAMNLELNKRGQVIKECINDIIQEEVNENTCQSV